MIPLLLLLAAPPEIEVEQALKRVITVVEAVGVYHADPVDTRQALYQGALPAMLRTLDPFSAFFDPEQFEQLRQMERSLQKGFGTVVSVLPGRVIVLQVLPGTPAARAGLSSGDEMVGVNGIPLGGLMMEQIVEVLGSARQGEVRLVVKRPQDPVLAQMTLKPETMESPSVDRSFLLSEGVGYVRVASFDGNTAALLREKIESLGGSSLQGLVLDLRGNPGGVVESALQMASLFLDPGKLIVTVKGRNLKASDAKVPGDARPYRFPLAVLIDRKTASASEIVTSALQDHGRAVVIGESSYGKGLVQTVFPLGHGAGLALTTAFYYTPNGRSLQRPLRGSLEEQTAGAENQTGSGVQPDATPVPDAQSRLRIVMEATGSFSTFAAEVLKEKRIPVDYPVEPAVMDEFRIWLSERRIQPSSADWSREREWIRGRLRQEMITIAHGLAKGDELEVKERDPAVRLAISRLASASPSALPAPPAAPKPER